MAYPTLPTIAGGTLATAADINTIMDGISYLAGDTGGGAGSKPHTKLTRSSNFTLSTPSTWTTVDLDVVLFDNTGISTGTGADLDELGVYQVTANAEFTSGTYNKNLRMNFNGQIIYFDDADGLLTPTPARLGVAAEFEIGAGGVLQLQAWHDSPDPQDIVFGADYSPVMTVRLVGVPTS